MKILLRKTILGTASILALGIAGTALDYGADAGNAANASNMPQPQVFQTSHVSPTDGSLRKDDIRWAQVELRTRGLYNGSLDGILGPQTRQALDQFQAKNGLNRTSALDATTWDALTGDASIGQGSSMQPKGDRDEPMANSPAASDLGR
jgi:peptidoglycan hydrolase-like protein with peptidoglycan-binding domain